MSGPAPRVYPVRKGELVTLHVEQIAFGGRGVARVEGYAVFVEGGLPGDRVEARVVKRKRSHAEARIERLLEPGSGRIEPRCRHFGRCGGCALQHLDYDAQLAAKREQVRDCLVRLGGLTEPVVEPAVGSPEVFEYRNKMEYTFSTRWLDDPGSEGEADRFGLGMHVRRRFDRVVDVERCHLHPPEEAEIVNRVREAARASGLLPYSTRTHRGFWRFLVLRHSVATGERMVVLLTHAAPEGSDEARAVASVAEALRDGPPIAALLHGVTERKGSVAVSDSIRVLAGAEAIHEELLGMRYRIGPNTFFQTNSRGAARLFEEALDRGGFSPGETVWDLYCGAGALTLPLARRVHQVVGIELVPEAVHAARRNAEENGVENVVFHAGDVRELVRDGSLPPPDAVVLDPPRDGIHPDVLRTLVEIAPGRIIYVSCNPATLSRDIAGLVEGGYAPGPVLPVDMFPHTAHVECVTVLTRAG